MDKKALVTSAPTKPRLAVSIVTYHTAAQELSACLQTLQASALAPQVTVVDNSPVDAARSTAAAHGATYVHLAHNPGYGGGHNHAMRLSLAAGFDYHLVLNADVTFDPTILNELVAFMDLNPGVAQVMPKVLNPDGSVQRLCKLVPSPVDLIFRRFLPYRWTLQNRRRFELWDSGYDKVMFVPYLSGCFMLLRCEALRQVGLFDERFFMYPEDIDLTRRLASQYDTVFYPYVQAVHQHGAASYKSLHMLRIHAVNLCRYFNKWGWVFDRQRQQLNRQTLQQLGEARSPYLLSRGRPNPRNVA